MQTPETSQSAPEMEIDLSLHVLSYSENRKPQPPNPVLCPAGHPLAHSAHAALGLAVALPLGAAVALIALMY